MMEVQKQWKNVNGKWQHVEVDVPVSTTQAPEKPVLPSRPAAPPKLPARSAPSDSLSPSPPVRTPALPPRRPSEQALSRRESNESIRSSATTETSLSVRSNGTSFTSSSDRFTIRAPEYDPASLPKLPPRRTQEEKDAQARTSRYPTKARKTSVPSTGVRAPLTAQALERSQTQPPPSSTETTNLPEAIETAVAIPTPKNVPTKVITSNVPPGAFRLPSLQKPEAPARPPPPSLPKRQTEEAPALPRRQEPPSLPRRQPEPTSDVPSRQIIPPPAKRSALSMGFGNSQTPAVPARSGTDVSQPSLPVRPAAGAPPPIPLGSRPDLAALLSSKPKPGAAPAAATALSAGDCLTCRNFTAVDEHAARFPRESIPSHDLGWLAQQLTAPFPSATDKARVIFTWLHHNVAYDVVAFFGNNVQPSTPASTLSTGLAVCQGYAELFTALAVKVGLESVVVGGHGKGYGVTDLKPGEPIPPYKSGHAWNAVKIDNGFWKLIDPCWGAGVVAGAGQPYKKRFAPDHFVKTNEDFGLSHWPEQSRFQYRSDGRTMSWEEYITTKKSGTAALMWNGFVEEEGMREQSFLPAQNPIVLASQGPTVRFSFQSVCQHYEPSKVGKGAYFLYIMIIDGLDGTDRQYPVFQNKNGIWWCDIPTRDLGKSGQKATIYTVTPWYDQDGRGLTVEQYNRGKNNGKHAFGGVAQWTIA